MLPPSAPTLFLCSPLAPNPQCTSYHTTAADSAAHILAEHVNIAAFIAANGRLRVQALPVHVSVHFTGTGAGALGGTPVWFCSCCQHYHVTEAALLQHLQHAGSAAAILDLAGQNGLDRYIRARCQRMLVLEVREDQDQDTAVDAAVKQHGFHVRVHFSAPYVRGSVLVFLATPTIAAFMDVIGREYAELHGVGVVDWAARFRKGVAVRINLRGGGTGRRLLQVDADLLLDFGMIEGMEAFVGDRREHGGVSSRG